AGGGAGRMPSPRRRPGPPARPAPAATRLARAGPRFAHGLVPVRTGAALVPGAVARVAHARPARHAARARAGSSGPPRSLGALARIDRVGAVLVAAGGVAGPPRAARGPGGRLRRP